MAEKTKCASYGCIRVISSLSCCAVHAPRVAVDNNTSDVLQYSTRMITTSVQYTYSRITLSGTFYFYCTLL